VNIKALIARFVTILNALMMAAAFIANPFISLFWPALPSFEPTPEAPPAAVEKPRSLLGYKISYAGQETPDKTAAQTLAETLNAIIGTNGFSAEQSGAAQGANEFRLALAADFGADEYLIEDAGDGVIKITGGQRGIIYGVYRFLEQYFDCRWYTHDFRVFPANPAASMVSEVKSERYAPQLEFRETDWISPRDVTYSLANGLNGNVYRQIPAIQGGNFGYNGGMAHTIINSLMKPENFFAAHPEWYAYRESGRARVPKQLCLTNPQVLAQMKLEVGALVSGGNGQPIISVTQDDNQDYCQCAECKRVDAEEGSHAGTMLRFVNEIAREFPGVLIDTFAYQYTRTPPKITRPLPNVIVRLCSIECCFAHALDDPKCPENAAFAKDIEVWSSICNRLYIWDYTTDYAHYNCYFPDFAVLQANMQFFIRNNVKGIYEEGDYTASECNSEFAELRAYLLARLMWNPDMDYNAEMNGFLKAYYGEGWQYLREFIDFTSANAGTKWPHKKMGIFIKPNDKDLLNLKINGIRYADELWEKAIALAGDEMAGAETRERRVLRSQLSWRYWKGCNMAAEFWRLQPAEDWQAANEQLYNDMVDFGITRFREGWNPEGTYLLKQPKNWWGTPADWHG